MRFALIGTPRSGNTLLRSVIAASLDLTECASHDPGTLLGHLPRGSITQVHAPYSTALHESLREREVVIVTPIRHPLDALLSMLHFAQFEPQVAQWLGGNHLRDVLGCDPTSRAFREFALGNGARALLQVSVDWAPHAALTVRFRDFCHDPEAIVTRLQGEKVSARLSERVWTAADFSRHATMPNMHGWMGRPDYWREFIPSSLAHEIREAQRPAFEIAGFTLEGAQSLSPVDIRRHWAAAFSGTTPAHLTVAAPV